MLHCPMVAHSQKAFVVWSNAVLISCRSATRSRAMKDKRMYYICQYDHMRTHVILQKNDIVSQISRPFFSYRPFFLFSRPRVVRQGHSVVNEQAQG